MTSTRLGLALALLVACSPPGRADDSATVTTTATGTTASGSGTTSGTTMDVDSSSGGGPKFDLPAEKLDVPPEMPIPVSEIPGLQSITFYEVTGEIMQYTFTVDGPELNNSLVDPL